MVWCRNQKIYNSIKRSSTGFTLWFDVGIKRYTTLCGNTALNTRLWFDVGIKRYTTSSPYWARGNTVVVWCRNQKIYNFINTYIIVTKVVVWCRNQKIYNLKFLERTKPPLWFDVGIKRYTTQYQPVSNTSRLWFDVGIKRYTTYVAPNYGAEGCGLM